MDNNELTHHGILGMRWGVRRYQNKDGSLTNAGRKRYNVSDDKTKKRISSINNRASAKIKKIYEQSKIDAKIAKAKEKANAKIAKAEKKADAKIAKAEGKVSTKSKPKSIKDMTDDEIRQKINRIRLENELKSLQPEQVSTGKKFVTSLKNNVIGPAARDAGKRLLTDFLNKKGAELLGLNKKEVEDSTAKLKKEVERLSLKKRKKELDEYWESENAKKKTTNENKSDKDETKTSTKNESKKETKSDKDPEVEVVGTGTSSRNNKKPFDRPDVIIDADFKDVSMNEVSKNTALLTYGQKYVDEILREKRE